MNPWPSVNLWAPIVAGVVAMVVGSAYWITRSRLTHEPLAPPSVSVRVWTLASRIWIAYGLAVIIGFARAKGFAPGAVAGALVYLAFPGTMLLAQTLFRVIRWKDAQASAPETLMGFAVMGGIVGAFAP